MALNQISLQRLGDRVTKKIGARKNLIINGAMEVAQRDTSSLANGVRTVDRFALNSTGIDGSPTQAQVDVASGTTPYSLGFRKAFKATNGNQTSGAGAADAIQMSTRFEAQYIAKSGWNYTDPNSEISLSFWVKSSIAQNFYVYLQTMDGTGQKYPFETGSLTADTWTKVTKTIPGNSNLQFDDNNEVGIKIFIPQFLGTNYTDSGATLNAWGPYGSGDTRTPDFTSTWYTTNDATFELTGVQLEVDSVATDFEFRSFAEELQLCKRYFQVAGGTHWGATEGTTNYRLQVPLEPEMRVAPTVTVRSGHKFNTRDQTDVTITDPTKSATTAKTRNIWTSVTTTGLSAGRPIMGRSQEGDLGDYLACDSDF